MKQEIENTPELEHVAALALNGLLSNPKVIKREELSDKNLQILADQAVAAAYWLEERLKKERNKG